MASGASFADRALWPPAATTNARMSRPLIGFITDSFDPTGVDEMRVKWP
jgi:hypothetical protein